MGGKNVIEIVIKATDKATDVVGGVIHKVSSSFSGVGKNMLKTGAVLGLAVAPFTAALGGAAKSASTFEESMTNVQAVLGASTDQTAKLSEKILKIGASSRAGPQAAADAFYDIVGGVADASTHMAILEASIATAEAGSAGLAGTTKALISVMNSYSFSADKATYVSDTLTRTVGMGVGSMEEFASALPSVTGLAKTMGISFDELAASAAFLTTKGFTASESTTQLRASMTALLNPNETMLKVFKELGVANGTLLVQQYGLAGALEKVASTSIVSEKGLARTLGSVEALNGVLALTGDGSQAFLKQFKDGIDGATAAAQGIQLQSVAAQMDLLKASVDTLKIAIGSALLPAINGLIGTVRPILVQVGQWASKNTKLIASVGKVVGIVAALAAGLTGAGAAFTGIGAIIGSSILPLIAIVGALYLAWRSNFGGIRDLVMSVVTTITDIIRNDLMSELRAIWDALKIGDVAGILSNIGSLFAAIVTIVTGGGAETRQQIEGTIGQIPTIITGVLHTIMGAFTTVVGFIRTNVLPVFSLFAKWIVSGFAPAIIKVVAGSLVPLFRSYFNFLASVWKIVSPALGKVFDWFVKDALPDILKFISKTAIPAVGKLIDIVRQIFEATAPYLLKFLQWFVSTGMPAVIAFIRNTVIPGVGSLIQTIQNIWTKVQPTLTALFNWFIRTGLPAIRNFILTMAIPAVVGITKTIGDIWAKVSPFLNKLFVWFVGNGLPAIRNFINQQAIPAVTKITNTISGIWNAVQPALSNLFNWFITNGMPAIQSTIGGLISKAGELVGSLSGMWDRIKPNLEAMYNWISSSFTWLKDNIIGPVIDKINSAINTYNDAKRLLGGLLPFATGGWTGAGSSSQVAGVVHGREWVIPTPGGPLMLPGALTEAVNHMAGMLSNIFMALQPRSSSLALPTGGGGMTTVNQEFYITVDVPAEVLRTMPDAQQRGRDLAAGIQTELRWSGGGRSYA